MVPLGVLLNKKFFLPITKGQMERSLRLLSISNRPSSKNTTSLCHCFRQYLTALPSAHFAKTFGIYVFNHAEKASKMANSNLNVFQNVLLGFIWTTVLDIK